MDIEGLERLLTGLEAGEITVVACDLTEPSPLALEVLSAKPYAFLDDAPLEERRTQAVMARRWMDPESACRNRPARPRSDRAGPLGGVARSRERGRIARRARMAGFSHGGRGGELARLARRARAGEPRRALDRSPAVRSGLRPNGSRSFRRFGPMRGRRRTSTCRRASPRRPGRARPRSSKFLRGRLEGSGPVSTLALAAPLGLEATRGRRRARSAADRRLRDARALHARAPMAEEWCDRAAARAHSPLHGQAPARRDRAGRRARLPALPVRLAACERR